jgi:hypothetical protein
MTTVVSRAKKVATLTEGHEPDEQGVSAGQALATPSHIEQTSAWTKRIVSAQENCANRWREICQKRYQASRDEPDGGKRYQLFLPQLLITR